LHQLGSVLSNNCLLSLDGQWHFGKGRGVTAWRLIRQVIRARRYGLLRLRKASDGVLFKCLGAECAKCCRALGDGVVVQNDELGPLRDDVRPGGQPVLKSSGGCCCLLKDGVCTKYDWRPKGCREYPWYNLGGELYYDSGCPGVGGDGDWKPAIEQVMPASRFFQGNPRWLVNVVLALMRRW